jgi:murein peptide amidase A
MKNYLSIHSVPSKKMLLLAGLIPLLLACASSHREPFTDNPPPQRSISALEVRLQKAVASSHHLAMKAIGQIVYPAFKAPVWRVSYRPDHPETRKILISAGIHGNEPAGVEYTLQLVELLARMPERYQTIAFDIIPVVNPWGWVHDIRYNRAAIDINRDFATFDSQEAQVIRQTLLAERYHLMLDLHEDPSAEGFYLYQYGLAEKTICRQIVRSIQAMGYPIEQNVKMVILKTDHGIIDAPTWGLWYMRLTGQLSIANYYRLNHSRQVFTVETPTKPSFDERLSMQRTAVEMFIDHVTK